MSLSIDYAVFFESFLSQKQGHQKREGQDWRGLGHRYRDQLTQSPRPCQVLPVKRLPLSAASSVKTGLISRVSHFTLFFELSLVLLTTHAHGL